MAWTRLLTLTSYYSKIYLKKYWYILAAAFCFLFYLRHDSNLMATRESSFVSQPACANVFDLEQKDPRLIFYLKRRVIAPPSGRHYELLRPERQDFSPEGQGLYLRKYFQNKENGTFIEAGAWDGETFSNTLILERQLGWTGLLIEPNPFRYPRLLTKHRKAHSAHCCLSVSLKPAEMNFSLEKEESHTIDSIDTRKRNKQANVKCFPLYSIMAATNLTKLDLLSLDVESLEVKILETLPWENVDITSILIEAKHQPEGAPYLADLLAKRNYKLETIINTDYFFVKRPPVTV